MFLQWMCIGGLVLIGIPLWAQQDDKGIEVVPVEVVSSKMVSEQRVALVIGNNAYKKRPLKNPINDADSMAIALEKCGFTVLQYKDLNRPDMFRAVRAFGERIEGGGVGLFYYSGHGIQVADKNYLVPVDADIQAEDEVEFQCLDMQSVLKKMGNADNRVNILILDACRDNPFATRSKSLGNRGGLATVKAPRGTFIAYATAPDSVALDGEGTNSPFVEVLVEEMQKPGLKIEEVFKQVRKKIKGQTPWDSSSLIGDFYFKFPQAKPNQLQGNYQAGVDEYKRGAHSMALLQWRPMAEQGDARAENNLGYMYYKGEGVVQDSSEAVKWFRKAAEKGYAKAQNNLGYMYYKGEGVVQDSSEAVKWFRKAAEKGFVYAQYSLGHISSHEAVKWFRKAAEKGYDEAQFDLSRIISEKNETEKWLHKAAAQGHDLAQRYLGLFENGGEIEKTFRQITNQRDTDGMYDMDTMCALVVSVDRFSINYDLVKERKSFEQLGKSDPIWEHHAFYCRGAEQGYDTAQNILGSMYYWGYYDESWVRNYVQLQKDYKEAIKWFRKAAEQGYIYAQYNLGFMYYYGKGMAQDNKEAAKWFRKAAKQGHTNAQYYMGLMYYKGEGVLQDYIQAYMWLNLAAVQDFDRAKRKRDEIVARNIMTADQIAEAQNHARELSDSLTHNVSGISGESAADMGIIAQYHRDAEQGNAMAQYNLGNLYCSGSGVTADGQKAMKLYHKAAAQGYAEAQYHLGLIYDGVRSSCNEVITKEDKDPVKWYLKAASQGHADAQFMLGRKYYGIDGRYGEVDLKENHKEAVKWYLKAAKQGHEEAQYNLGFMYQYGKAVEKDPEEGMKWYLKAAEQGHADAQYNLGLMYANMQNYVQAYMWLEIAETSFWRIDRTHDYYSKAREKREEITQNMTDGQITEAQDRAEKWDWSHRD